MVSLRKPVRGKSLPALSRSFGGREGCLADFMFVGNSPHSCALVLPPTPHAPRSAASTVPYLDLAPDVYPFPLILTRWCVARRCRDAHVLQSTNQQEVDPVDGWSIIGAIGGIWRKSSAVHEQALISSEGAARSELCKYATLGTLRLAEIKALRHLRRLYGQQLGSTVSWRFSRRHA